MLHTARLTASTALAFVLGVGPAAAYDYLIKPVPANLAKDADTTLLVDFAKERTVEDFAAGERPTMKGEMLPDGALRGAVLFAPAANFNPRAWTVEMIVRLPAESVSIPSVPIGGWITPGNYNFYLNLTNGSGPAMRLSAPRGQAGRAQAFNLNCTAGGNGYSLHQQGVGQWAYLAFGIDFAAQRARCILRNPEGDIFRRVIHFAGEGGLDAAPFADLPEAQRAAVLAKAWADMGLAFAKGLPAQLSFGGPAVDLLRLRVSKVYRRDVLEPGPQAAGKGETAWTVADIDPGRAKTREVTRVLGYGSYNERPFTISESTLALTPDAAPLRINLKDLKIGLYSFYLYGTIDPKGRAKLDRVWKPCPVEFEVANSRGERVEIARRLLKQSFGVRRMQGFALHVNEPGDYVVTFKTLPAAQETPLLQRVTVIDHLAGLPDEPIKRAQNIAKGKTGQLTELTAARKQRDDAIWSALPPCNLHLQVHGQCKEFSAAPAAANLPRWETKAFLGQAGHSWPGAAFAPLDMINPQTKEVISQADIIAGKPWPGPRPDDGTGIYLTKAEFPELTQDIYVTPRALLLGARTYVFLGLLGTWDWRGHGLPVKYFDTGNPNIGHDAALALVRLAYDWPALEMNLHEIRLCTHAPDFEFNTDWSAGRNGKYFYEGWSGAMAIDLLTGYDQLFPYIQGNQVFADAVHRFIPWIKTPDDVVRFLDRQLVFASVKDFNRGLIRAADVPDVAAQVLGPHRLTASLLDLTTQQVEIYPCKGTFQELYATALSRSGCYYIASFMVYALGDSMGLVEKAYVIKAARDAGAPVTMDLSDLARYPRVTGAVNFIFNMWTAGGFPFMVGDASGGPHTGPDSARRVLGRNRGIHERGFALTADPRFAFVLKEWFGSKDEAVLKAAEGVADPFLHAKSRVVPDYAAFIEGNPQEKDLTRKTAATLRLGVGQGHAHADYLDLNLFAMGLPLAVDLACRNEGDNWSRPGAAWSFLHNHAIAHDGPAAPKQGDAAPADPVGAIDPSRAGSQTGEPRLRAFAPPLLRATYSDSAGKVQLDRDVLLMSLGDTGNFYAFDLQRLSGGEMHTWCFHGCESNDLALNVPMAPRTVRWIDRTLDGTHRVGAAVDTLQATWQMTREGREYAHKFGKGGVIKTVACEPAVLGARYDAKLPPVNVRATLLGRAGDAVMQGNPYSQNYAYCFPFLWVQGKPGAPSVYPAVYEWYRGDKPVIAKAELLDRDPKQPLRVQVVTTTGQTDLYIAAEDSLAAVSRDDKGLRWVKVSGPARLTGIAGLTLTCGPGHRTVITEIDYKTRTLRTKDPLPRDPGVVAGNDGRRSWLELKGKDNAFTWGDDLLIHEGLITSVRVLNEEEVSVTVNQRLLFGGHGNRKPAGFVFTNEDATWQFRCSAFHPNEPVLTGRVLRKPQGAPLTASVFTDANGDTRVHLKTYELGLGDELILPADVELRRTDAGCQVLANLPVEGVFNGKPFRAP
jgi:hypothetical protein